MSDGQLHDASDEDSDSDTEWIEVESSAPDYVPPSSSGDVATSALEITLQPQISKRKRSIVERFLKMHERSQRIELHNTHLLCLLARAQLISKLCSDQVLQAALLSLMPSQLACRQIETHLVQTHIEQVLWWYKGEFENLRRGLDKELQDRIDQFKLTELHLFTCLLTVLGHRTRLVQNLIVTQGIDGQNKNPTKKRTEKRNGVKKISSPSTCNEKSPYFETKSINSSELQVSRQSDRLKRLKVDYAFKSAPDQTVDSEEEFQTPKKRKKDTKRKKSKTEALEKVRTMPEGSRNIPVSKREVSPRVPAVSEESTPSDEWLEIRLEEEWRPLHYKLGVLTTPDRCTNLVSEGSLVYVIGSEVNGKVRDVTARYSRQWGGRHAKLRLDNEVWASIISLCSASVSGEDELESSALDEIQLSLPLPPKLTDFKSNPYYTLERHLLKFQAIHPENCPLAGSFRGDKVYFRRNVAELHTRENWLKEGRVIISGETAYKSVKGRNKPGAEGEGERMIELFGKWQTKIYIPPPVVDGKIPKNEFGNVELFQPFMLPEGAAHIDLPGVAYVSRKLGIDYALAMVGWEFHGIACHPVFRGIVVAQENEDLIRGAWLESEETKKEKERTVREKKVFERWRKVIRAALIKERVKEKFNISNSEMEVDEW